MSPVGMDILRPVGRLEKCSTARQALGLYRSVIVTCRYKRRRSLDHDELEHILFLALSRVVSGHSALCCSIAYEGTESPAFTRLESIDLRDVVTFVQTEESDTLVHHFEQLHDQAWTFSDHRPAWKVVVFQRPPRAKARVVDIAFVFHHALADGLSGAAFHRSLLQELQNATTLPPRLSDTLKTVRVPHDIQLMDPLETLVRLPLSWGFLARQVFQEYGPRWLFQASDSLWAGRRCETLEELPYKSRLRMLEIPAEQVEVWLTAARRGNTTLTAFITGVVVVSLTEQLPEAERFVGTTPYTMRRVSGTSMDDIVNQTSGFNTTYGMSLLEDIRASAEEPLHSISRVWEVARYFQSDMKIELNKCPLDNLVGLLPYISSYRTFYEKKLGQPRETTFEVSNLGSFTSNDCGGQQDGLYGWAIEDMLFSQGAQVVGAAFAINCVSVRGGPLNLAFSWQDGVVSESVIDGILRQFQRLATGQ